MTATGIRIAVRAQPKAGRDGIEGLRDGAAGPRLVVKVTAAADRGRANAAIEKVLARALGVPPTAVAVVIGDTGRDKIVEVRGDSIALRAGFEEMLSR